MTPQLIVLDLLAGNTYGNIGTALCLKGFILSAASLTARKMYRYSLISYGGSGSMQEKKHASPADTALWMHGQPLAFLNVRRKQASRPLGKRESAGCDQLDTVIRLFTRSIVVC